MPPTEWSTRRPERALRVLNGKPCRALRKTPLLPLTAEERGGAGHRWCVAIMVLDTWDQFELDGYALVLQAALKHLQPVNAMCAATRLVVVPPPAGWLLAQLGGVHVSVTDGQVPRQACDRGPADLLAEQDHDVTQAGPPIYIVIGKCHLARRRNRNGHDLFRMQQREAMGELGAA